MTAVHQTVPRGNLRVAAIQRGALNANIAANVRTAIEEVRIAADRGARVVLTPELFLSGYDLDAIAREAELSLTLDDPRLDGLRHAAARNDCVVIASAPTSVDGQRRLSALIIGRDGTVSPYHKRHLWGQEREIFTPGSRAAVIDLDGWKLGVGICYEVVRPDFVRTIAQTGAHAFLAPSAFADPAGFQDSRTFHAARARENALYSVFANMSGPTKGGGYFSGGSIVFSPYGIPVAETTADTQITVVAELDRKQPADAQRGLLAGFDTPLPVAAEIDTFQA